MNDSEFLGYCEIHSETPRALFSPKSVYRLYQLAGSEAHESIKRLAEKEKLELSDFIAMHHDNKEFQKLMKAAKERKQQ